MGVLLEVFACYKVRETVNTQVLARNKLTGCRVVILRAKKDKRVRAGCAVAGVVGSGGGRVGKEW